MCAMLHLVVSRARTFCVALVTVGCWLVVGAAAASAQIAISIHSPMSRVWQP
jgi:hypothetical protein